MELVGKRLQLFRQLVPKIDRLAVLFNPSNPGNVLSAKEWSAATKAAGIRARFLAATDVAGLAGSFEEIAGDGPDALACVWDSLHQAHAREIAEFAIRHRVPVLAPIKEYVQAGALMSYGAKLPEQWERAARYVDRILKGAPAELPVEQPLAFELVINRKTAKALGIRIPPELLLQADKVLE